jgi:hypothetical protein
VEALGRDLDGLGAYLWALEEIQVWEVRLGIFNPPLTMTPMTEAMFT